MINIDGFDNLKYVELEDVFPIAAKAQGVDLIDAVTHVQGLVASNKPIDEDLLQRLIDYKGKLLRQKFPDMFADNNTAELLATNISDDQSTSSYFEITCSVSGVSFIADDSAQLPTILKLIRNNLVPGQSGPTVVERSNPTSISLFDCSGMDTCDCFKYQRDMDAVIPLLQSGALAEATPFFDWVLSVYRDLVKGLNRLETAVICKGFESATEHWPDFEFKDPVHYYSENARISIAIYVESAMHKAGISDSIKSRFGVCF